MAARKSVSKSATVTTTPVRNSAIPPRAASPTSGPAKKSPPTYDQIARKAYEIWQSGKGGGQDENWYRAERELRGY
jgi:hypothetical protein